MILLLDTSTPTCYLTLIDGDHRADHQWLADRRLAHGLLGYIDQQLAAEDMGWADLTGLGVFQGPGSFTGLRIGLTVLNTMADSLAIPIVGAVGPDWQPKVIADLKAGLDLKIVLPVYGRPARITLPRK